jgi:3-deoxy-7-phosphoheptulonate synthase
MINHYCDCFQIGARSQQNYSLLRKLGKFDKPIFLKRNTGCTVDEWLGSAEHLLIGGAEEIYLIERGSSTFHNDVRWTPTIHVIPSVKSICEIPVIVDASHSTGRRDLVPPITLAGIAAGADGFLVEVHTNPDKSLSDAEQAIDPETFEKLMKNAEILKKIIGEN